MESTDRVSSIIAVMFVGVLAVLAVVGTFALIWVGKEAATIAIFTGLGGAAVGGIITLATTRSGKPAAAPDQPPGELGNMTAGEVP